MSAGILSAQPIPCDGCGTLIPRPTEDFIVDGAWCCHNCAKLALHDRGPFADQYPGGGLA